VSPGSAIWQVTAGADKLHFVNGQAEGIANGTASVTATVDGITSDPVLVSVGPEIGTLTVNVKDPTGTLVPKSTVTLRQSGFQIKQGPAPTGTVTFSAIAQGATEIRVAAAGFHDNQATVAVVGSPTPVVDVTLTPTGTPIATNVGTRLIETLGNAATFETDIAITDENGQAITSFDPATFLIDPVVSSGATVTFQQVSTSQVDPDPHGNFSLFLATDATESMRGADPTGSRIQGMKALFGLLPNGSNAMFGYFPGASGANNLKAFPEIGFVSNGSLYYPKIDALASIALAGTPLYNAVIQAIDVTSGVNSNPHKAVVVLTDGHQTNNTATLAQAVNDGKFRGIRVFTVSLGLQTYANELAELAQKTGGGTALATNPLQLTSFYKSLPALLRGQVKVYRTRWTAVRDIGDFPNGSSFAGTVKIPQTNGALLTPFFLPVK
jgi:hypothetical protein